MIGRGSGGVRLVGCLVVVVAGLVSVPGVAFADDTTPPSVVAFSVDPSSVDVSAGDQVVTATAEITDDQLGVTDAVFTLVGPLGGSQQYSMPFTLISGDSLDGVYTAQITLPAGTYNGDWLISLSVSDGLNQQTSEA